MKHTIWHYLSWSYSYLFCLPAPRVSAWTKLYLYLLFFSSIINCKCGVNLIVDMRMNQPSSHQTYYFITCFITCLISSDIYLFLFGYKHALDTSSSQFEGKCTRICVTMYLLLLFTVVSLLHISSSWALSPYIYI
eukprot:1048076_1